LAELDRTRRGDDLAAVAGAVEIADELALQRLDRALVLEPGELRTAAVVGREGRRRSGHRQRCSSQRAGLEERAPVGRNRGLAHGLVLHASGPKNLSTSNLPACRAGAPTALRLSPFLPQ